MHDFFSKTTNQNFWIKNTLIFFLFLVFLAISHFTTAKLTYNLCMIVLFILPCTFVAIWIRHLILFWRGEFYFFSEYKKKKQNYSYFSENTIQTAKRY